ncbi:MAG TPA: nuclear transport factor 2 family protein [Candidatus Limnocylindrales bacterium]|nr:nuclear transport factor 2 family protein [Candidatus Limnocylindrales bacterium]
MADTPAEILELAQRFFAAIEAGDVDAVRAGYAPGAVVWHNHDLVEQSVDENLATLAAFIAASRQRSYAVTLRQAFAGGFVQEHVLTAISHAGKAFELPACIVCRVQNGRITRLDEYFDSAQVHALIDGLSRGVQA